MERGVYSFVNSTCHHETVFAKLNLKVKYAPSHERVFWDYSRANKASINQAINVMTTTVLVKNVLGQA